MTFGVGEGLLCHVQEAVAYGKVQIFAMCLVKSTANVVFPVVHCVVFTQHVKKLKGLVCVNVNGLNGCVGEYCIFYILC